MAPRKDFGFIGRLCLDFAQTGDMGWGASYERLTSPPELSRWMRLCSLELPAVRSTNADLAHAKKLRGAIWRIAQAILSDDAPRGADVRRLNAEAKLPLLTRVLSADGGSMHLHHPTIAAAFAAIAQDAVTLFGDDTQRVRLRRCENAACRVIFYDDSRPGSRRWCAPNRCGDRIRAYAYRQRTLTATRRKSAGSRGSRGRERA